jgi:hypothetical protein
VETEPTARGELVALWPQEFIGRDCFAILAMDVTAPFIPDMGLCIPHVADVRRAIRVELERQPMVLRLCGTNSDENAEWLEHLAGHLRDHVEKPLRESFWGWIRDTYTMAPADRPNWEMYERFFYEWSVKMRDGEDTAGCFNDARLVYEAYSAFVQGRMLSMRIHESRRRQLSFWDVKIFELCGYSLSEAEVDYDTIFDPFAAVQATAERNYFQAFWEYLLPELSGRERDSLFSLLQWRYQDDFRLPLLASPPNLVRRIR